MAAKHGILPKRPAPSPPAANPLELIEVRVGDKIVQARPFELSTNVESGQQYPSRAVTGCPLCGHGIYIDICQDQIMSGLPIAAGCDNCKVGKDVPLPPLQDPFCNPLVEGVVTRADIDPLYTDLTLLKTQARPSAATMISSRRRKPAATTGVSVAAEDSLVSTIESSSSPEAERSSAATETPGSNVPAAASGASVAASLPTGELGELLDNNTARDLIEVDDGVLGVGEEPEVA